MKFIATAHVSYFREICKHGISQEGRIQQGMQKGYKIFYFHFSNGFPFTISESAVASDGSRFASD